MADKLFDVVVVGSGASGVRLKGFGRLSPRSLAAVATFMIAAMATTFLVRHAWGGP